MLSMDKYLLIFLTEFPESHFINYLYDLDFAHKSFIFHKTTH